MQWIWGRRAETAQLVNRASQTEGKASPGKGHNSGSRERR